MLAKLLRFLISVYIRKSNAKQYSKFNLMRDDGKKPQEARAEYAKDGAKINWTRLDTKNRRFMQLTNLTASVALHGLQVLKLNMYQNSK